MPLISFSQLIPPLHFGAVVSFPVVSCPAFLASPLTSHNYVQPNVEYASVVWSSHNVKLIRIVENVQRRFTKRLSGCSQLSYSSGLAKLNWDSLELRRLKVDLTYAYRILFGLIDVSCVDTFSTCNSRTRGHSIKLSVQYNRIDVRKFFFSNRVVLP